MKKVIKLAALLFALLMVISCFASCSSASAKVIDIALTDEDYAFGVAKDDPELLKDVNDFVKEIKENGTLQSVIDKYYSENGKPTPVKSAVEDANKDQLVVATNAAFPPFESLDGDSYYGIDIELMKLLADKLNKELVIKNVDFDAVCSTVDSGYADIAAAGLTVNESRKAFVTFSEPYFKASQMIIIKDSDKKFDDCKTADDVLEILGGFDKKVKIGVQTGTTGQFFVEGSEDFGFDGLPVTCTGYSNGALAVQDLLNGNIDYVVIDEAPAKIIVESFNGQKN